MTTYFVEIRIIYIIYSIYILCCLHKDGQGDMGVERGVFEGDPTPSLDKCIQHETQCNIYFYVFIGPYREFNSGWQERAVPYMYNRILSSIFVYTRQSKIRAFSFYKYLQLKRYPFKYEYSYI